MTPLPSLRQVIRLVVQTFLRFFVLFSLLFSAHVQAQDVSRQTGWISQRAYLDDPSGQLSFTDVQGKKFTPFEGFISRGNSNKTLWLKLDVPAHNRDDLVLSIEPAYLRSIDVYTQNAQGQWLARQTGSRVAFEDRERSELYFALGLEAQPRQVSSIYVRLNSPTLMIPNIDILGSRASYNKDNAFHIGIAAYISVSLMVVLASLAAWRFSRDGLWIIAAAHDLVSMVSLANMTGFTAKYFMPNSPALAMFVMPLANICTAAVAYLFFWRLLKAFNVQRWIYRIFAMLFAVQCVPLVLLLNDQISYALLFNNSVILVCAVSLSATFWWLDLRDTILTTAYRAFVFCLCAYGFIFWLPVFQITSPSIINLYVATPGSLLTMGMLTVMLSRRLYLQIQHGRQSELLKNEAQKDLRIEEAKHAGTAGLLGMILHEVKNPLTSIRMATSTLSSGQPLNDADRARRLSNIQRAIDGIDLVLESCTAVDKLERGQLQLDPQPEEVVGFLNDWLADTYDTEPNGRLVLLAPQAIHATLDMRVWMLMVRNLVDNSLKYSPEGSPVTLQLSQPKGYVVLNVRNLTGKAGVPDANAVFNKYYRAPQAMGKPGTGLGLYWVHEVSAIMGGSVRLASAADSVEFELSTPC